MHGPRAGQDWDGRVQVILGEERSQDPVEAKLARDYCNQLQSCLDLQSGLKRWLKPGQNRDSEGLLKLGAPRRQTSNKVSG